MNENIKNLIQIEADLKKIYIEMYGSDVIDSYIIATVNKLNDLADSIYSALSDNDKQVIDSMGYWNYIKFIGGIENEIWS